MPEEPELETKELQEALTELHQEREEREDEEKRTHWTRYIALSTAILAVFAALAALESGNLVNEAMMAQLRASDTWNEYQAAKQKIHIYTVQANALLDAGARQAAAPVGKSKTTWVSKHPDARLEEYVAKVDDESSKSDGLKKQATALQERSEALLERHHAFAHSVALIQSAIALAAIAALTRVKWIWYLSLAAGLGGLALLCAGFWR